MTSKLPIPTVRKKDIAPLMQIANDLENHLEKSLQTKNDKIQQSRNKCSTVDAQSDRGCDSDVMESVRKIALSDQKVSRKNYKLMLEERDTQIEQLIDRLTVLHDHNTKFANEIENLQTKECDACHRLSESVRQVSEGAQLQRKENLQLQHDIKMMKTLVYRLNVQLERYQDIVRTSPIIRGSRCGSVADQLSDDQRFEDMNIVQAKSNINWGKVNSHTLGPLLTAYTETINEKSDLVQEYENELKDFTGRLKEVIAENEKLHEEMGEMKRNDEMWSVDKTRMQAQLDICRNKAEIQTKRADLAKEKLVEVLRCYEQKLQSQNLDLERLQEAYSRSKGELAALKNIQKSPEIVVESLKECQKLFEELKGQHAIEKAKLTAELNELQSNLSEMSEKHKGERHIYDELKKNHEKQAQLVEQLSQKNAELRQSLARVRLSRESFRNRLKASSTLQLSHKRQLNFEQDDQQQQQQRRKKSWQNDQFESSARAKNQQYIQSMHMRYLNEIEKLTQKLHHRDDTLKKVLHARIDKSRNSRSAAKT